MQGRKHYKSVSNSGATIDKATETVRAKVHRCEQCQAEYTAFRKHKKQLRSSWVKVVKKAMKSKGHKTKETAVKALYAEAGRLGLKVEAPPLLTVPDCQCSNCRVEHITVGSITEAKRKKLDEQAKKAVSYKVEVGGEAKKGGKRIKLVAEKAKSTPKKAKTKAKPKSTTPKQERPKSAGPRREVAFYCADLGKDYQGLIDLQKEAIRFKALDKDGSIQIYNTSDTPLTVGLAKQIIQKAYLNKGFSLTMHKVWPKIGTESRQACKISKIVAIAN